MSQPKRPTATIPKRRNPLHDHPLLGKGGAHGKTRKAERRAERVRRSREWPVPSACMRALRTGYSVTSLEGPRLGR